MKPYKLVYSVTRLDSDIEEVRDEADVVNGFPTTDVLAIGEDSYQVEHAFNVLNDDVAMQCANDIIEGSNFYIDIYSLYQYERLVSTEEGKADAVGQLVEEQLSLIYRHIGIDNPSNHEEIKDFVVEDVKGAAGEDPTSEDVKIAFRHFIERNL